MGGPAMASGFDLTLMCDIRYASQRARFGGREVLLSLTPILNPLWMMIGPGPARGLALTERIIDAEEACRPCYVSRIFPEGGAVAGATETPAPWRPATATP